MTYTSHGHHIPGTIMAERPTSVARCGGPALCKQCGREAGLILHPSAGSAVSSECKVPDPTGQIARLSEHVGLSHNTVADLLSKGWSYHESIGFPSYWESPLARLRELHEDRPMYTARREPEMTDGASYDKIRSPEQD